VGVSGEGCPDTSVSIPAGYHWAKLWLFRAQLDQRTYPTSAALGQLGPIACNPGRWDGAVPGGADVADGKIYPFPDCAGSANRIGFGTPARFSQSTGMCWNIGVGTGGGAFAGTGSDTWAGVSKDPTYGCTGSQRNDPAQTCTAPNVPRDTTFPLTTGVIDKLVNNPIRYDYMFVVTPPAITRAEMDESASTNTHNIYTPLRFQLYSDCQSNDPSFPLSGTDCLTSRMIKYKIKKHQVGFGGNEADGAPGDFPVFVLQKD
jgi:hypothetical protein